MIYGGEIVMMRIPSSQPHCPAHLWETCTKSPVKVRSLGILNGHRLPSGYVKIAIENGHL